MKKESLKTAALALLVLCSVFLTSKLWSQEKLWPEGYNFFLNIKEFFASMSGGETYSRPKEALSQPRKIVVVNDSDSIRAVFYNSDVRFAPLYEDAKKIFDSFLSGQATIKHKQELKETDWQTVLEYNTIFKSAYISFPIAYTPKLFGQVMGVKDTSVLNDLSSVKDFLILTGDGSDISILAMDYKNHNKVMRYQFSYPQTAEFAQRLSEAVADSSQSSCFISFEYAMDEPFSPTTGSERKTTIDSYVVINDSSEKKMVTPTIVSHNPLLSANGQMDNGAVWESIIRSFGYSPLSIRRYVDSEGTLVYVENHSTLKLYLNGLISYSSLQAGKGVELLGADQEKNLYESLNAAIDFIESISQKAIPDKPINLVVSSDLLESTSSPGKYKFTFDYYFDGTQVVVDAPIPLSQERMKHGAEVTMENGIVTDFKFFLRDMEKKTDDYAQSITMLQAVDMIYEQLAHEDKEMVIQDIFLSFLEDGTGQVQNARWTMKVNNEIKVIH